MGTLQGQDPSLRSDSSQGSFQSCYLLLLGGDSLLSPYKTQVEICWTYTVCVCSCACWGHVWGCACGSGEPRHCSQAGATGAPVKVVLRTKLVTEMPGPGAPLLLVLHAKQDRIQCLSLLLGIFIYFVFTKLLFLLGKGRLIFYLVWGFLSQKFG